MNKFTKAIAAIMLITSILGVFGCNSKGKESAKEKTLDFVDLGLPSGTMWATCNIGADNSEEVGYYFAWGETFTKNSYESGTYKFYYNGDAKRITKYCTRPDYGCDGFVDNLFLMDFCDDAAIANWGEDWKIPTCEDWKELLNCCKQSWTKKGREFVGPNGNSIFLPATGYRYKDGGRLFGEFGYYWSNMIEKDTPSNAWYFRFCTDFSEMRYDLYPRYTGMSVRPVRTKGKKTKDSNKETEEHNVLVENQDYKILLIDRQKLVDNYFVQIFTDDLSEENVGNLAKSLYNQYYHGKNINIELFDYEFSTDFLERYLTLNKGYSDCTGEDYVLLADHSICFLMFGSKTGDYYPMQDDYSLYVSYGGKNWKK